MVSKAELDVPVVDTSSHCASASSLLHNRVVAGRLSRCFRLCSLLPSSLMYNCLILLLTFLRLGEAGGAVMKKKEKLGVSNTSYNGGWWVTDGGWWVTAGGNMRT